MQKNKSLKSENFKARYHCNQAWLKDKKKNIVHYNFFGNSLAFESNIDSFLSLLSQRFGCFFSEKEQVGTPLKLISKDGLPLLIKPSGKTVSCKDLGEVFFPHITHAFDQIFTNLNNHIILHAASFSISGKGVLIMGNSELGKTTLALEMAKSGAMYLADDVSVIEVQNKMLLPNPQGIKIKNRLPTKKAPSPFTSPHLYKNPCEIDKIIFSNKTELSAAVLLLPQIHKAPVITPMQWELQKENIQNLIIPPALIKNSIPLLKQIFVNIPFATICPRSKGDPAQLAQLLKSWIES